MPSDGQHSQQSRVAGFNDQSCYDPFLPSSPDDEHLVHLAATHLSPNPQAYRASLSPAPSKTSAQGPTSPPLTQNNGLDPSHCSSTIAAFHDPVALPEALHDPFSPLGNYDFLSPNAHFSDHGYIGSSEHTGSPDYGGDFYPPIENGYGLGLDGDFSGDLVDDSDDRDRQVSDPVSAGTRKSQDTTHTKTSIGTATLYSHLMSPMLTDTASPGSRDGQGSPLPDEGGLRMEAAATTPLNSSEYTELDLRGGLIQQTTPALTSSSKGTGSSKGTSPDRLVRPGIARAMSPNIRIESYSRGDSPARGACLARAGSKRSHASSHLAVEQDDDDLDDGNAELAREDPGLSSVSPEVRGRPVEGSSRVGLDPQERLQLSNDEIPNFQDQEEHAQAALKKADVEDWLSRSEASSEIEGEAALPPRPLETPTFTKRRRAKSTGDSLSRANLESLRRAPAPPLDFHIPGPGVLINEDSGEEDENVSTSGSDNEGRDVPESPPPTVEAVTNGTQTGTGYSLPQDVNPEAPSLYRAKVWHDPLYDSTDPGVKVQPTTSNEAIYKYELRSHELETLSRAATWGTRRMSDSDLAGLFRRLSFSSQAEANEKDKSRKRTTFLEQAAARLRPKRSGSMLRRKESESPHPGSRPATLEQSKKDSSGSLGIPAPLQRMSSLGKKSKSPRINTGSAVAALTSSVASLGAGTSHPVSATNTSTPTTPWTYTKNVIKRSRSRSDIHGGMSPSKNLTELLTKQGGPPMPTLAAPPKDKEDLKTIQAEHSEEFDDEEDAGEDKGVTIDLSIRAELIVPTLEGFRSNVRQLNPRLPTFMVDRISQEQLRRYKRLVEFKIKHAQAISLGKCGSGKLCPVQGGEPTYLPSKSSNKEPELSHTGFSIAGNSQSDDEANALSEGIVTAAQFPAGVPMPPVKRLPAEFECSLCFKVKKFHKPSDWSKHVHEDVQPFTCTFADCAEPKSFKRKADWVRHENERHRQLEWWLCNYNDCNHKCYRKDNFVQHLVREHKLPEPKIKTLKSSKPAVRGPSAEKARKQMEEQNEELPEEVDQVWRLVGVCRHETPKNPKDEACKFCGNVCNSWKKLTVHLAKHMEQISMPILGVVETKEVTPETVVSPIEQRNAQQPNQSPCLDDTFSQPPFINSQYGMSATAMPSQYTPMHSSAAYGNPAMARAHRANAYYRGGTTYPPQVPGPPSGPGFSIPPANASPYNMSSFPSYDIPITPSYAPINDPRAFTQSQSPENVYDNMRVAPATHPSAASYASQGGPFQPPNGYQQQSRISPTQQQHQRGQYSNPMETSSYTLAGTPLMPSFSQGAPTGAPMPYNPATERGYPPTSNGGGRMYQVGQSHGFGS